MRPQTPTRHRGKIDTRRGLRPANSRPVRDSGHGRETPANKGLAVHDVQQDRDGIVSLFIMAVFCFRFAGMFPVSLVDNNGLYSLMRHL
jgi:hypothetical protein